METATKGRKRTAMPEKEERGMLSVKENFFETAEKVAKNKTDM